MLLKDQIKATLASLKSGSTAIQPIGNAKLSAALSGWGAASPASAPAAPKAMPTMQSAPATFNQLAAPVATTQSSGVTGTFNKPSGVAKFGLNNTGQIYNTKTGAVKKNWNAQFDSQGNFADVTNRRGVDIFNNTTNSLKDKFAFSPTASSAPDAPADALPEEDQEDEFAKLQLQYEEMIRQQQEQFDAQMSQMQQYQPQRLPMDAATETTEGRLQTLLDGGSPVIRQAADRARQAFAERGLLNSSMAEQAAMEAMISKAIEIAGPDAEKYFSDRQNATEWANRFNLQGQQQMFDIDKMQESQTQAMQTNYQTAIQSVDSLYSRQLQDIQMSQLDPASKESAVNGLKVTRDNSIRLMTATFQQFPGWKTDWSSLVQKLST